MNDMDRRDWLVEFSERLHELIKEANRAMIPDIGNEKSSSIVMTVLAVMGQRVEIDSGAGRGKFARLAEMSLEETELYDKRRMAQ